MQKNALQAKSNIDKQKGFSLVEILVTVLIMAAGSLGIAAMQITGLNYSAGAYGRTQSVILADDMANRLQAYRDYAIDADLNGDVGGDDTRYAFDFTATPDPAGRDCIVNNCSPAEIAEYDQNIWLQDVARALPSGQGSIMVTDRTNPNGIVERQFEIGLQWRQIANSTDLDGADIDAIRNFSFRVTL